MKKIKKLSMLLLTLAFVLSFNANVSSKGIEVEVNNKQIEFDVPPMIISSRTMIPIRATLESLGAEVEWNQKTKTAIGKTKDYTLYICINSKIVIKEDNETLDKEEITMDVVPSIINGRTLVPVRFMAETLGNAVIWDNANQKVIIIDKDYILSKLKCKTPNFYEFATNMLNGEITEGINSGSYSFDVTFEADKDGELITFKLKFDVKVKITEKSLELHLDVDYNSIKNSIDKILKLFENGNEFKSFNPHEFKLDLYYDGVKCLITSPLLENEEVIKLLKLNRGVKHGIVFSPKETLRKEINSSLKAFTTKDNKNVIKAFEEIFKEVDTKEDLDNLDKRIDIFAEIFNDNNFKKTTYDYSLSFNDVNQLNKEMLSNDFLNKVSMMKLQSSIKLSNKNISSLVSSYEFELNNIFKNINKMQIKISSKESNDNSYKFEMPETIWAFDYDNFVKENK